MRRFSQRNSLVTLSDINITPLLDLAFVLLIIFVITTPLLEQGMSLKLPKGGGVDPKKLDPRDIRTVEVSPRGEYMVGGRRMSLDQISNQLVFEHGRNPNKPPSDAQQKGQILAPTPAKPVEAVRKPEPVKQPPEPKADIKKVEARSVPKKEVAKVPNEPAKPAPTPKNALAKQTPLDLKPIVLNQSAALKAKAEAEARELALANKRAASQLNKAI